MFSSWFSRIHCAVPYEEGGMVTQIASGKMRTETEEEED